MSTISPDEPVHATLVAVSATDIGMVREHNEDSSHISPERGFFIVADGMGGHAAGEVASAMAVDRVRILLEEAKPEFDAFASHPTDDARRELVSRLQAAVLAAHQAVFERGSREKDKEGMGTTLDVCVVAGREAFIAHVGDSRTYLIRGGRASQITTDHTVAQVRVIEGTLSAEEAAVSPWRTILVNALGVSPDVGVELAHVQLRAGDRLLICSDGLHDYFPTDEELALRVSVGDAAVDPAAGLHEMIELAKERGGHDNITGIVVHIIDVVNAEGISLDHDNTEPVLRFGNEPTSERAALDDLGASDTGPHGRRPSPPDTGRMTTEPMTAVHDDGTSAPSSASGGKAKGKATKSGKAGKSTRTKSEGAAPDRVKLARADTLPPTTNPLGGLGLRDLAGDDADDDAANSDRLPTHPPDAPLASDDSKR